MGKLLWKPSEDRVNGSNMKRFLDLANEKYGADADDYASLYEWSVENIPDFWELFWDFSEVISSASWDKVVDDDSKMPGARWFSGAKLNFAENLLRYRDEKPAIISICEHREKVTVTYSELFEKTARLASSLRSAGVVPGDRVVGFMPNIPETIVAMLAATSIGAVWSSCSPDFGIKGVLDRFGQTRPKVLFTADGYSFKGKSIDSLNRIADILKTLPSVEKIVVVPHLSENPDMSVIEGSVLFDDFMDPDRDVACAFEQLPFDHPLYIMYSSGTTGLPKCMVQGAGGVLLHHMKELMLHTDLKRGEKIFYYTSCGWMMWNWLVSSLSVGATLVLFDGNPFHPDPECLWRMADEEDLSVFGTSAGYISALQHAGVSPMKKFPLKNLRTLLSTGSPLLDENFEYVYEEIKVDIQVASISGGSDLNGCFALGNPFDPVYAGELQGRGLAMKVDAWDDAGNSVTGVQGELVCSAPFPSMPIYFWDDAGGEKYHGAYFSKYPGVWRHGDYIEVNEHGGVVIYGRSDATLNPGGVRIGTAEIYRQVERLEEIEDSLVIGQKWKNDERIILFVKPSVGVVLDQELVAKIRKAIRIGASPRHVPAKVLTVPDIPYTLTMKKVEMAVSKVVHNQPVSNRDALKNPEILDCFENIKELSED